jgi:hypothetical protein
MDGCRIAALGDNEVDRLGTGKLDVRPRRVEVGVRRDHLARPADDREEDLLGGASLVRRDDVLEREELLHRGQEAEPRWRAGVRLITALDGRPLLGAHGARS